MKTIQCFDIKSPRAPIHQSKTLSCNTTIPSDIVRSGSALLSRRKESHITQSTTSGISPTHTRLLLWSKELCTRQKACIFMWCMQTFLLLIWTTGPAHAPLDFPPRARAGHSYTTQPQKGMRDLHWWSSAEAQPSTVWLVCCSSSRPLRLHMQRLVMEDPLVMLGKPLSTIFAQKELLVPALHMKFCRRLALCIRTPAAPHNQGHTHSASLR